MVRGDPPSSGTRVVVGEHREFADLYEIFLDAVHDAPGVARQGHGRWLLARQIAKEIRDRGARDVLDCAAGSGFPALDLATGAPENGIQTLHCTDGDPEMIRVLRRRARELGVALPRIERPDVGPAVDPMLLTWSDLTQIRRSYDYVLCRGNSLAYADTWTGDTHPASQETLVDYLHQIADKVRPGGYLHVDAPRTTELRSSDYPPVASGAVSISERVETEADDRHWQVDFKLPHDLTLRFERYSSQLTVHDLSNALRQMGFVDTEPFTMTGERPNFGVIIARRPE